MKEPAMAKRTFTGLLVLLILSCYAKKDETHAVNRPITEAVYSSVTIQPDSLYQAYAAVNGILDQNLVEEGDLVQKGTPLVQIINSSPKLNTENAKLELELARRNYEGKAAVLQSIEDEIKAAELSLAHDSVNFMRQRKLWEQKIGSKAEYDARKLAYELSSNSLSLLKNKYDRTQNELKTQLQQAENNYRSSLINTTDFTVKSKINGKVYALPKNPGEIVTTTQPVASVGSADKFIIEMLVDEVDIVKIKIGQEVLVSLDSYPGQVFPARLRKIYPKKDEKNQTFTVEALFEKEPKVLYPGLSGEGNIIIAEKEKALVIPKEYLIDGNKVRTDDGMKQVETGLQSLDSIEIKSGLSATTTIYKPEE